MFDTDVAIIGAGAAGLSLAHRLTDPAVPGPRPSVVLLDAPPGPLRPPRRTWCFWEAGRGPYESVVTASWERLRVHDRRGAPIEGGTGRLRYKMIRSDDFEALVHDDLTARPALRCVEAAVDTVRDLPAGAEAQAVAADGSPVRVRARWVFDSRPPGRLPPAHSTLLQHFHGWFVRTERPVFTPQTVDLMDFRTPQPPHGLSFGYVLPTGPCTALVEYTEFSSAVLPQHAYDAALRHYTGAVLGLGELEVTATETGVIPMTDARFTRRTGPSVFRIGVAGGATRPATGYTFATVQRQTRAIVAAYRAGRPPVPPPPHPARFRLMDAVLLRALDTGRVTGADFFPRLFRRVPTERLLRFLDGRTRLYEDLAIGIHTPVLPMLRTVVELPRLPRRPFPGP